MLSGRASIASALAMACCLMRDVSAHSYMMKPLAKFREGYSDVNNAFGQIDFSQWKSAMAGIDDYKNAERFAAAYKADGSKTVRDFIMKHVKITEPNSSKECGQTVTTGEKQPVPSEVAYAWGHPGPCEIWCDNTKLFFDPDCNKRFNNKGTVPIDTSKCKGASLLQAMYIGTHNVYWEVYTNCAPLVGGTETDPKKVFKYGTGGETSNDAAPAPGPAPVPASNSTTTTAPASSAPASRSPVPTANAPSIAPAPAPATTQPPRSSSPPSITSKPATAPKCNRRSRA